MKYPIYDLDGIEIPSLPLLISTIKMFKDADTYCSYREFTATGKFIEQDFRIEIEKIQHLVFKGVMAFARQYDIEYFSLNDYDLIAPIIKTAKSFDRMFTWILTSHMDLSSCGNGVGNTAGQSQIYDGYMPAMMHGVWNPHTEQRWTSKPFALGTDGKLIDAFLYHVKTGTVEEFIKTEEWFSTPEIKRRY